MAGVDGWRRAILRAAPSLNAADLDAFAAACPFAAHGPAYAVMVVQAWARRHLDHSADALGARSAQLDADSQHVMLFDGPRGWSWRPGPVTCARSPSPFTSTRGRSARRHRVPQVAAARGASAERVWCEEAVLAGLLRQDPQRNAEILRILPAEAFTNPHRKEMYHVLTAMNLAGRPVDELTVDWEARQPGRSAGCQAKLWRDPRRPHVRHAPGPPRLRLPGAAHRRRRTGRRVPASPGKASGRQRPAQGRRRAAGGQATRGPGGRPDSGASCTAAGPAAARGRTF